jgi:hypothetical protein
MKSKIVRSVSPLAALVAVAIAMSLQGLLFSVAAQQAKPESPAPAKTPATTKPAVKRYQLKITEGYVTGVSLKAKNAKMSEIAADLEKQLGAKVILAPSLQKDLVTVEFVDLPFEPAMQLLSPHTYIDYEIRANAQPKPLGIYLYGNNDPVPATDAVVTGDSQGMLIEGNTEDDTTGPGSDDDTDLQVDFEKDYLTVTSKHQRLAAVVLEVADAIGVPAEIRGDSTEFLTTEFKQVPIEDGVKRLSPNVRFYVRADLNRAQRTPLRLVLIVPPPEKAGTQ